MTDPLEALFADDAPLVSDADFREDEHGGARTHFKEQLKRRYDLDITDEQIEFLEQRIIAMDRNWVRFLQWGSQQRKVFAVRLTPNLGAKVVFDPSTKKLVTALPPPGHPDYIPPRRYRRKR